MLFKPKKPQYTGSSKVYFLKQGYDIKLVGASPVSFSSKEGIKTFSVQPPNFRGIVPIPKVVVEKGDIVKAGDLLCYDKKRPEFKFVSPVSGEVIAIQRGLRRSIKEIVIESDADIKYKALTPPDEKKCSREELVDFLLDAGVWPFIRQRPFNEVAGKDVIPKNIFISTFDTAPLAPDLGFIMKEKGEAFQKGLDILGKLTDGDVHLGLDANGKSAPSAVFRSAENVKKHWFHGKHPSGNVGVQIHHIAPIRGAEKVWTLNVQDVAMIGNLFLEKRFNAERVVVIAGSEVRGPKYIKTFLGACLAEILSDEITNSNSRVISGDVLSGEEKIRDEFLNAFDDQITVIPEGNTFDLFGWLFPNSNLPSISRTYLNHIFKNREFKVTTNQRGEGRSFVVTGDYESVLPMNILPQHLAKAIITSDIEKMEGLGINEIEAEDIAICEFACLSKQPLQKILRDGQDMLIEQS